MYTIQVKTTTTTTTCACDMQQGIRIEISESDEEPLNLTQKQGFNHFLIVSEHHSLIVYIIKGNFSNLRCFDILSVRTLGCCPWVCSSNI